MEVRIQTLAELEQEAVHLVGSLTPLEKATLVTLSGELGTGKPAFVKAAAHALCVEEVVTSPTFVLEKIYLLPEGKRFKRLIHIDAYRLEKGNELSALGFDELMQDATNLVFLEWPEKVAESLPAPAARISLIVQDDSRILSYG